MDTTPKSMSTAVTVNKIWWLDDDVNQRSNSRSGPDSNDDYAGPLSFPKSVVAHEEVKKSFSEGRDGHGRHGWNRCVVVVVSDKE